ncbi:MAG: type II toxin-antitoxin system VapC family toxin [Patescibacteria group bacterium]
MHKNIFLDANILIYSQDPNSLFFKQSVAILKKSVEEGNEMFVSPYILNEVHFFFTKQAGNNSARKIVNGILKYPSLIFVDIAFTLKDIRSVFRLSAKYSLKTFDAFHAYYCKKLKIKTIATFDKDFRKLPWLKVVEK